LKQDCGAPHDKRNGELVMQLEVHKVPAARSEPSILGKSVTEIYKSNYYSGELVWLS